MSDGCRAQSTGFQDQIEDCRPRSKERACSVDEPVDGVEAAVSDYIQQHRARAARELEYFSRLLRTDEEALSRAALALLPSGKRHPHQYRVPRAALEESRRLLLENLDMLRQATSFDELFAVVEDLTEPIKGIGELTVYDTALRIGAHFGCQPARVYLHAGTRKGGQALGFDPRRQTIEMDELPEPMRQLSAREAEDLLCIYKDWIA
jgi:hypothetical protein